MSTGRTDRDRIACWLLTACSVWPVGLGIYFIALQPPLLPEVPGFTGSTLEQLRQSALGLESWLRVVYTVIGGYMVGSGVLSLSTARVAMHRRLAGTACALAFAGLAIVGLMSAMNFMLHSDFRWLLVVPAVCWAVGVVTYVASRRA